MISTIKANRAFDIALHIFGSSAYSKGHIRKVKHRLIEKESKTKNDCCNKENDYHLDSSGKCARTSLLLRVATLILGSISLGNKLSNYYMGGEDVSSFLNKTTILITALTIISGATSKCFADNAYITTSENFTSEKSINEQISRIDGYALENLIELSLLDTVGYSSFTKALHQTGCTCCAKQPYDTSRWEIKEINHNYLNISACVATAGLIPRAHLLYLMISALVLKDSKTFFNNKTVLISAFTIILGTISKYFGDNTIELIEKSTK